MFRNNKGQFYGKKKFVKSIPNSKIIHYSDGKIKSNNYISFDMKSDREIILRSESLEACRRIINKYFLKNIGQGLYQFQLKKYPHLILRENKFATGAGADRISSGMRNAFGTPIGVAVKIKKKEILYHGKIDLKKFNKENFTKFTKKINSKLPLKLLLQIQ